MSKYLRFIILIEGVIIILLAVILFNTVRNKSLINIDEIDSLFIYSKKNKSSNIILGMTDDQMSIVINHHQDRISISLSDQRSESNSTLDIGKDNEKLTLVDLGLDGSIDLRVQK